MGLLMLLQVAFLFSCRELTDEKYISEGIIEYDITYPEDQSNNLMAGLMPDKMIFKFKDGKVAYDITGGLGMFKSTIICDPRTRTVTQLLKVMNNKYAVVLDSSEVKSVAAELPVKAIKASKKMKEVAGYKCEEAEVVVDNPSIAPFNISYTQDINLKEANWGSPFRSIEGVLMEFDMKKYNIQMRLKASSVSKAEIDDSTFILPDDYKIITRKEMDEIFMNFN